MLRHFRCWIYLPFSAEPFATLEFSGILNDIEIALPVIASEAKQSRRALWAPVHIRSKRNAF